MTCANEFSVSEIVGPTTDLAQRAAQGGIVEDDCDAAGVLILDRWRPIAAEATLPVSGLTARRVLRVGMSVLGRQVLVTGASDGVGQFASSSYAVGSPVAALRSRDVALWRAAENPPRRPPFRLWTKAITNAARPRSRDRPAVG